MWPPRASAIGYRLPVIAAAFIVLFAAAMPAGAVSQNDPASLTGLTTLSVVVEDLPQVATANGLASAALQGDTERVLRGAGIQITPDSDAYLYIRLKFSDAAAGPIPYLVDVSLMQEVTLPRNIRTRAPFQCPTWGDDRVGAAPADQLRKVVTDRVAQFVGEFVKAYQTVNKK